MHVQVYRTSTWKTFTERAMSGWKRFVTATLPTLVEGDCNTPDSTEADIWRKNSSPLSLKVRAKLKLFAK